MKDYMIRATAGRGQARLFIVTSKELVEEARQRHNTSPVATAALGRLLTGGVMMGSMLKNSNDILTLKINGDGPIGQMLVTATSNGTVKGYVQNPDVMLPASSKGKLDVGGAVGKGTLTVIKDMGLKEPYAGTIDLVSGEIAEDLTYYFVSSEQVNSCVALGVLMNKDNTVKQAGGFILQLLPFAEEDIIEQLEMNIMKLPSMTALLDEGNSPEDILKIVTAGLDSDILDNEPVAFKCDCSKDKVEKALISIGRDQLKDIIDDGKDVELVCHFCNRKYNFAIDEIKDVYKDLCEKNS